MIEIIDIFNCDIISVINEIPFIFYINIIKVDCVEANIFLDY